MSPEYLVAPGHGARPGALCVRGRPVAGLAEGVSVAPDHGAHAVQLGVTVPVTRGDHLTYITNQ